MKLLAYFRSIGARFLKPSQVENDMDEELRSHIQLRADDLARSGLSRAEAERRARVEFGGQTRFQEECREAIGGNFIETFIRDVRFSLRVLRKSPGFTVVAILTLAFAIGANSVVFGVVNSLILRRVNVPQSDSLYEIARGGIGYGSYPDYVDLRDRNRAFDGLASFNIDQVGLDTGDNPTRAWVIETSGNYFDVLRIRPFLGRFYAAADEHGPNSAPFIVLTYAYWHNHFSDDRTVIGRVVRLNKYPFTILGVAPPEFHGTLTIITPDLFVPIVNHEQVNGVDELNARYRHWMFAVTGHLKPGVTPAQAVADLNSIGSWLREAYPKDEPVQPFTLGRPGLYGDFIGGPVRSFVAGLMLLAGLILLAACANLGSLFAARAADRGREVALRLALGASRNRILRALFTEAVLISLSGGAVGLLGSILLLRWLGAWQPFSRFPIHVPVTPDASVYASALVLALVSGLLFGMVPVRQVLRTDPYQIVKGGSAAALGRRISVRDLLVVVQIAICALLVTSSMVALRGLERSLHSNTGIEPRHAMLISTPLKMAGYTGDRVPPMQKRMIDTIKAIPGVESVALVDQPQLTFGGTATYVYTDKTTDLTPSNAAATPYIYIASPEYFSAAGTALLIGRPFDWHDDRNATRVAVVNRTFARKVFGSEGNATGGFFKRRDGTRIQVVGVVEDGKYLNLAEEQKPAMFLPILQSPDSDAWLIVRSHRDPQQLAPAMKIALRNLDSGLPLYMQTWSKEMSGVLFAPRMATASLGVLGLLGAMLSITGIFGMAAYSVSKRLRELGIRIAVGARPQEVLSAALGRSLKLLAIGSAAGLLLGILATRFLAFIVYQATPRDPLVLGGVALSMLLLGLLATWIPAQRALSLDPLKLLREE